LLGYHLIMAHRVFNFTTCVNSNLNRLLMKGKSAQNVVVMNSCVKKILDKRYPKQKAQCVVNDNYLDGMYRASVIRKNNNILTNTSIILPDDSAETVKSLGLEEYFKPNTTNNTSENGYLDLVSDIIQHGELADNRTGKPALKLSGRMLKYPIETLDYRKGLYRLPFFTTKQLFYRGAIVELLWMLRGSTDTEFLVKNNVKIWNPHASKEFLEKRGLDYLPGELGPVYGHQWVNWGAKWVSKKHPDRHLTISNGINQITNIIKTLVTNPFDRRIIIQAYNVSDIDQMALPPCHMTYLFDVCDHRSQVKSLNCHVLIRSNDMFLGHPFNVAGASMLTSLIASVTGMKPGEVTIFISNAHVYINHIDQVKTQCIRTPYQYPLVRLPKFETDVGFDHPDYANQAYKWLSNLEYSDFNITGYQSWSALTGEMAV
jgi:thymidylate synthase